MPAPEFEQTTPRPSVLGAMRALAVDRVTAEVVAAFDAAGVPSILLKGPSIGRWLYPAGDRTYMDTDLLVPADAFDRAGVVLKELGFVDPVERWPDFERPPDAPSRDYLRRRGGQPAGVVDLHRTLSELDAPMDVVWSTLSANTETLTVAGVQARVLNTTALALHIVLHAVHHGVGLHGHGLHTAEDLRRLIERLPPEGWGPVAELARALGAEDRLALGLRLDPQGTRVAEAVGLPDATVESSPSWLSFAPRGAGSLSRLSAAPTLRDKLLCVRWAIFPSQDKVRYVSRVRARGPMALARAYGRWWQGLARSAVPAIRYVLAHRRTVTRFPFGGRKGSS